jgi:hypothetical protein
VENSAYPSKFASALEKEIGESLEQTLAPPWRLQYPTASLDVRSGSWAMNYTPDFLITNSATGHTLAVEVKSSLSLSMANIVKLQHIQSALKAQGKDFLLVVHRGSRDDPEPNADLGEYGIHAVGVNRAVDAASEIEKQLAT